MALSTRSKLRNVTLVGALGLSLTLAACGGSSGGSDDDAGAGASADCADYTQYGNLKGKTISIYTGIVAPEDTPYKESYKPFEKCTGATVKYEADKGFETQILVRSRAGNPPDIAYVPQPGLLKQLVATGKVVAAPAAVSANVDKWWGKDWKNYGTVDGKFYSAPNSASVKSLVWYSPSAFQDKGYTIPKTLDELKQLSDKIAADNGAKPWCAGISSGDATGWPVTDWMEDFMLRLYGPDEYDKWVNHQIPFNSAEPTAALNAVGDYLKNPKYVNGGLGDVKTIASTTFQEAGQTILDGTCSLHRQASFYAANWPKGTKVAQDGEVFAFYLPGKTAEDKPVLGAGEFTTAFSDRPEVQAFQTWLSTDLYANIRAKLSSSGGWVSANKGLKKESLVSPIDQLAADLFQDPKTVFRFDGSDQMPAAVGSDAFWKQATAWITGRSTQEALDNIEAAWPKS